MNKTNALLSLFLVLVASVTACGQTDHHKNNERMHDNNNIEIYLAGGCFWGTEHFLKLIDGVESTEVGYANSTIPEPTYEDVCTGMTGATETVRVVFDSTRLSLPQLLQLYFETIDPTALNRQGPDRGTQYRTGIYYTDPELLPQIRT